jgi:PTH1 family peptidyl-tRNA hydrolase
VVWLIVGLGNPGPRYQRNRHNLGFRVVDRLAEGGRVGLLRAKHGGEMASGTLASERVLLFKPMEFMNLSGFPVQRAAQYHQVEASRIIVIHDEIDFDEGRVQIKMGGGHGGHNGLRSIIEQLGDKSFVRVRIGVGRPGRAADGEPVGSPAGPAAGPGDRRVAGYLLSDFPLAMDREVEAMLDRAAAATLAILAQGPRDAMNEFNERKKTPIP